MEYQKIIKVSKKLQQNNSEIVTNENKEIPKERCIFKKERQEIIDNLGINIIV